MLLVALFITAIFPEANAACSGEIGLSALAEDLRQAEGAFAAADAPLFLRATAEARAALPCLSEPMTPGVAAAWHRSVALERIVSPAAQDRPLVLASLRAMSRADPGYRLPAALAFDGSVLPALLSEAEAMDPPQRSRFSAPDGTFVLLDGAPSQERELGLPVVAQLVWRQDLRVHATIALAPDQPMPSWSALGALPPPPPPPPDRLSRPATLALAGGAIALSLVAGGALGWGEANRATFYDPETPYSAAPALQQRSHALTFTALGAGLGAAGLGALVVLSGQL